MFTQSLADKLDGTQQISKAQIPNDIQRLTELYLRDRLLSLEERAATYLARRYKRFTRAVRALMTETASDMGLTNTTAPSSYLWRSFVEQNLPLAVSQLQRDVTVQMYRASLAAYAGMYYGRAWALESMVAPEVRVNAPPINIDDTLQMVDVKQREAIQVPPDDLALYNQIVDSLQARQWSSQFSAVYATLTPDIARSIMTGVQQGESLIDVIARVDRVIGGGTPTGTSGNLAVANTLSRTVINQSANDASIALYRANADLVQSQRWISAKDERTCPRCFALDGTVHKLSEMVYPPAHRNCRCTTIPVFGDETLSPDDSRLIRPTDRPIQLTLDDALPSSTLAEWLIGALEAGTVIDLFTSNAPIEENSRAGEAVIPQKYDRIDFTPPQGVREACAVGVRLFEQGFGGDGLEDVTVREARAMARGEAISVFKANKGYRFWQRNERFLDADDKTSPQWVSAQLWGGRPGKAWFEKLYRQMQAADAAP